MSIQEILRIIRLYGKKITQLGNATLPLSGSEKVEIVQGGTNVQCDVADFVNSSTSQYRGDWAGTTTLPATGGTGVGGAVAAGDRWRLTDTLVISSNVYSPGTIVEAAINTPGQTLTNWNFYSVQL